MNQFPGTNYHDLNLNWLLGQMKNCLAEWETTKGEWTALETDNEEFKAYVTNYFDNLDVTQEISDKIDALVEDGTLLRILTEDEGEGSPLSDTVGDWLAAHITQETGYVIDDTLTVQGAAADAKATGDAITEVKSAIENTGILPVTYLGYVGKGYISTATLLWTGVGSDSYRYAILPVKPNASIKVVSNGTLQANFAALKSFANPSTGDTVDFSAADGWTAVKTLGTSSAVGTFEGTLPADSSLLYIYLGNASYSRLPTTLEIDGYDYTKELRDNLTKIISQLNSTETDIDNIESNIESIETDVDSIESVYAELLAKLAKNFLPYYILDSSVFAVGNLTNDGEYNPNTKYRICTPELQIAITDVQIRPREGFRVAFRLFTNGVYTSTLTPGTEGTTLTAGQQYKMIIRRATEDTSETVTVADFYDKALFFNPIQKIGSVSVTGDPRYVFADYGLLPQAVFYPGLSDTYNTYDYNTTAETIFTAFDALVTAHGEYITKSDLGICSDGIQHVYMYDFNPHQKSGGVMYESLPTIFLLCGQHGYEKISVYAAYYMLKHIIENSSENPILNYLRNHVRIVCVPVANPYGFNQKSYKNYNGVNLNRNWDADWRTGPNEDDPSSKDYAGEAPFDQPETAAIRDAFLTLKSGVSVAIDFHTNGSNVAVESYGEMNCILYTDRVTPLWMCAKKAVRYHIKDITSHLAEQYNLSIADDVFCGMTITNHSHHGQAQQWFDKQEKIAFTFEVFPGFPGGITYTADTIKASEEMIANFLVTVLNYIK